MMVKLDPEVQRLRAALDVCEKELRRERAEVEGHRDKILQLSEQLGMEISRRERVEAKLRTSNYGPNEWTRQLEVLQEENRHKDVLVARLQRQVDEDQIIIAGLKGLPVSPLSGGSTRSRSHSPRVSPRPPRLPSPPLNGRRTPDPAELARVTRELQQLQLDASILKRENDRLKKGADTTDFKHLRSDLSKATRENVSQAQELLELRKQALEHRRAKSQSADPQLAKYKLECSRLQGDLRAQEEKIDAVEADIRMQEGRRYDQAVSLHREEKEVLREEVASLKSEVATLIKEKEAPRSVDRRRANDIERHRAKEKELEAEVRHYKEEAERNKARSVDRNRERELDHQKREAERRCNELEADLRYYKEEAEKNKARSVDRNRERELEARCNELEADATYFRQEAEKNKTQNVGRARERELEKQCNELQADARYYKEEAEKNKSQSINRGRERELEADVKYYMEEARKIKGLEKDKMELVVELETLMVEMADKRKMTEAIAEKATEFATAKKGLQEQFEADKEEITHLKERNQLIEDELERIQAKMEVELAARRSSSQLSAAYSIKINELMNKLNDAAAYGNAVHVRDVMDAHMEVFEQLHRHCESVKAQSQSPVRPSP